ncbi:hypothetical protein [Clostridium gasigenes]|uniref:hypothetical protein n=1 Tax=Clostridium gasigenes TaxID=94869 RepID=UPI001C0DCAEB|nr:hypothetical protein [Clostridium gasigenes]MBU3102563.1 hypothetical protein [Clostridium gasigenes]
MYICEEDEIIKEELIKYYPDMKIVGIYNNKRLNNMINRRWEKLGVSKREYLTNLGFIYSTINRGKEISEENIEICLNEIYPKKIIPNISDISKKDRNYIAILEAIV